ncbi:MAG: amidohydrolase family protein [Chloroflexota bacterium]|nr:MAG: amidohydrolase [Chloroflexota bacterium]
MRIDVHIHYTPPSLRARLAELAEREPYWGLLLAPETSIQGWADAARMLADMDQAGIGRVIVQGEYFQRHESCVARNDESIALMRAHPGRVSAFACLQPRAGDRALDELARCVDAGFAGVGELNPYAQGFALDDPAFLRLCEACIRYGLPLLLHANEPVGRYYPGKATTPLADYHRLATRYPELRLVLAHWGGGLLFYETIPSVRRDLRNVWYDTAASPLVYATDAIFRAALACVDHRKILYGSDYPLRIVPREQREPDFRPFLRQIDALGLDDEVRADILGRNAERLLAGLGPADDRETDEAHRAPAGDGTGHTSQRWRPPIGAATPVAQIAAAYPAARAVLERYDIPWQTSAAPFWEPIGQAAAARGHGPAALRRLLAEIDEAAGAETPSSTT